MLPREDGYAIKGTAHRNRLIGLFYTELTRALLGGEIPEGSDHSRRALPDIYHWLLEADIEVKGAGNSNPWLIWLRQLERNLARLGDGYHAAYSLYAVWVYRNAFWLPRGKPPAERHRVSRDALTANALHEYLGRHIMTFYLFDARVLKLIAKHGGERVVRRRRNGEKRESYLHLSRMYLRREFGRYAARTLPDVGARKQFRVKHMRLKVRFRGMTLEFPAIFVLPSALQRHIRSLLDNHLLEE